MSVLLALSLAATPAAAPFSFQVVDLSRSHARVLLAPRGGDQATLLVRFHAGSVDDGTSCGLTRLAQHVALEANRRVRYEDLLREVFGAGATLTLATRLRDSSFVLTAPRQDFPRLAGLLLEMLRAPDIDDRLWPAAVERALADEKVPGGGSDLAAFVARKVVDDVRYHNEPFGERADLETVSPSDVLRHLRGPMAPANSTVVVAGAFDARRLRAMLRAHSGGSRARWERPRVDTPFSLQVPARQTLYLIAYRTALDEARRAAATRILAELLEERLLGRFRAAGLGYAAGVLPLSNGWLDQLLILLPTGEAPSQDMSLVLEEQIARVRRGDFTDEEVERSRGSTLGALARIERDSRALAQTLADGDGSGWYGQTMASLVRSLARGDLQRAAAELFDESRSIRVFFTPNAAAAGAIPDSRRGPSR